jgi:hypothetical protein
MKGKTLCTAGIRYETPAIVQIQAWRLASIEVVTSYSNDKGAGSYLQVMRAW